MTRSYVADAVMRELSEEMVDAQTRYGPFASSHEGYGVLMEEVAELLDAIRANRPALVAHEAIQVAAVALRLASCCTGDTAFLQRSGMRPADGR